MEKFKISDIQEIFTSDVERFHSMTEQYVSQLLNDEVVSQEALDEALRQCHTLKGLAATVEAWGLSCLGADLERLLELAGSWAGNEREKANGVFEFILEHMQDWYVMNQFTCMAMLPQAWDVYQGLRGIMDERWPGYLPTTGAEAGAETSDAQYVRLSELEISEVETGKAKSTAEAPTSDGPVAELMDGLDVKGAQPMAASPTAQPGAPLPVRVVPPTLRQRDTAKSGAESQARVADLKSSEASAHTEQPATPKPLQVVPPALRRRDGVSQESKVEAAATKAELVAPVVENVMPIVPMAETPTAKIELSPAAVVPPAGEVPLTLTMAQAEAPALPEAGTQTPPILRVAPPALKRLGKKLPTEDSAAASVLSEKLTPSEITTPSEPVTAEVSSAEAIFAALPETTAAQVVAASTEAAGVEPVEQLAAAKSAEEFKPGSDADLLELLSQEVAGYLAELSVGLTQLAGNLGETQPWEQARRLFHTIKGTAATFGLDTVSAPAKVAEARCIVAVEDESARTREMFETCVHRASVVAKALHLVFEEAPLREALRAAEANAANAAALASAVQAAQAQANVVALDPEMAGFFINDTRDQIGIIEQAVLRWEKGDEPTEQVQAAQRGFHTIKGAGNSIGLSAVALSVHEVEAFLEGVAANGAVGSKAIFTFLLGAVDQLRHYLVDLGRNTASPWRHDWSVTLGLLGQPVRAAQANEAEAAVGVVAANVVPAALGVEGGVEEDSQTLRIETSRLYQLMNLISEMVIDRARLARKIEQLAELHRALAERNGALTGSVLNFQEQFEFNLVAGRGLGKNLGAASSSAGAHGEFSELEFDRYDQFNVLARSLVEISHDIEVLNGEVAGCLDSFAAENVQFTQTSQELQSKVTGLSLVPVNTLFPRLQRAFRDALNVEGKEADLVLSGGEALLDKVVVDKVYAPLLHLLRNAVSHGIEDALTRSKGQKPARGKVVLSAAQLSNQIVLTIADDGGGVDVAAVRERAMAKGWLTKDAPALTSEEVAEFIFRPGFSTASKVTSVSGRGIGLDVVRKEVENLNGSVELRYVAGVGTTWTLRLPLMLSISEAILTVVGGTQFAFPLNFIEAGLILEQATSRSEAGVEVYPVERRDVAPVEGEAGATEGPAPVDLLPVLRLSRVFGLAEEEGAQSKTATLEKGLIVSAGDRRVIVVVDVVLRRQEVVVKQLDVVMAGHPLLNGASLDAEGRVIPILNLPALLKFGEQWAQGQGKGAVRLDAVKGVERTRVLVVDDSLSVRKVQERFLRDLGCEVVVASDGLVALEKLREGVFDLILTDLEMPRVNGYELISEVRGNPVWSLVPVVVISSRGADKYITKAMNLGASTFLSKPFTQEQLKQVLEHYAMVKG